ncbi:MAG: glutamine-hydrolyzing GMP synthase [Halobacteriovoraceae bacterium]|nr:glutamine-hydrolyzing GMP synthase [Halobacteriovoraceae bacterium]|tara:strand:+ start:67639 stop:69183 length:1545 start_codon:yes stop_codon:yes gene_type:complete
MSDVWIVDFGSQYTQLITRKARELGYSSVIITVDDAFEKIDKGETPLAFILSGGPHSVFEDETDYSKIFKAGRPLLGICYGMQLVGQYHNGTVEKGEVGEYGHSTVLSENNFSFPGMPKSFNVWMSHSDHLSKAPEGFEVILKSNNGLIAGIENKDQKIMALQFHPEVNHTEFGKEVLKHFFHDIANVQPNWSNKVMLETCLEEVREVKGSKVLCAFSGGVDSLVAATIAQKELGDDLYCFFVDNGLLRPQDHHHIVTLQKETGLNIEIVDASETFLNKLKGVDDPEKKRKIIGNTFIEVFEDKVKSFEKDKGINFEYLLQGTLYPDVIESISPHKKGGKSVTIKSHHNVGGLPERMNLKLLEPLKFLFKDEVRQLGEAVSLKHDWVYRHPFPGPGIGVRVLGELFPESIKKVQGSDQILFEELKEQNLYEACWQAFTVLLPVKTVGVKGDSRAYEEVICVRIVNSTDGMTATWTDLPHSFLSKVSNRITNEVRGVTRVVYDITSKPPGTIEWE